MTDENSSPQRKTQGTLQKRGWKECKTQKIEGRAVKSSSLNKTQWMQLWTHRNCNYLHWASSRQAPFDSLSWVKERLMGPQALILNYRLQLESGRGRVRFLNSMATQKALIKSRRANPKPKDIKVETTLVGKGNVQGREWAKKRWGESHLNTLCTCEIVKEWNVITFLKRGKKISGIKLDPTHILMCLRHSAF